GSRSCRAGRWRGSWCCPRQCARRQPLAPGPRRRCRRRRSRTSRRCPTSPCGPCGMPGGPGQRRCLAGHRPSGGPTGVGSGERSCGPTVVGGRPRSEEHTSELQSRENLVCRLLLEKKKNKFNNEGRIENKNNRTTDKPLRYIRHIILI